MPIPDFQTAMRPALVAVDGDEPRSHAQIRDSVAAALGVTDAERLLMIPSGRQELFTNRVAWALTHMNQAGLLTALGRNRRDVRRYRIWSSAAANVVSSDLTDTVPSVMEGTKWR